MAETSKTTGGIGGKYVRRKVAELSADPANVRKHNDKNLDAIKASLLRFGQQKPIVIDSSGVVRAGNGTLAAAKALGWAEIDCVQTELSGAEATAYAIADNRTAELAEWDEAALTATLQALEHEDATLLEAAGFDEKALNALVAANSPEITEDEVPEPPAVPVTKPGDLWLLGEHRLLCGDSTDAACVTRLLGDRKPFIMVTDPPYGVEYDGGEANEKKREKLAGDATADLYEPAFALSPCAVAYAWFAGSFALPVYAAAIKHGFQPRALIIWNKLKPHYGAPMAHYKQRHEPCLYAVKRPPSKFVASMSEPTVWDIEQPRVNEHHPTQKPVECMARPIRNHGGKDDDVYDPFLGSGTTLIAAEQLGRKCYGLEIDPGYCDVIVARWEKLTGKKAERVPA